MEEKCCRKKIVSSGIVQKETLAWLADVFSKARVQHKAVIVFMHHGVLEHYPKNKAYMPHYVLENNNEVASFFAKNGVRLVFTGHFHAQDITQKKFAEYKAALYDIETGSLITTPCAYRTVTIRNDQVAEIRSATVESIAGVNNFPEYKKKFIYDATCVIAEKELKKFHMNAHDRACIEPQIAGAYMAHLRGDEVMPPQPVSNRGMGIIGRMITAYQKGRIIAWWNDLPPADNSIDVNLKNGELVPHK